MRARSLMSFRDFDWQLLGIVLLLCAVSVVEIYSATLHTKFLGFHTKQMLWIAGGLVVMFILSQDRLPSAARLGSVGVRRLSRRRHCRPHSRHWP